MELKQLQTHAKTSTNLNEEKILHCNPMFGNFTCSEDNEGAPDGLKNLHCNHG